MATYVEAITPGTARERREQIHQELIAYRGLDRLALMQVREFLPGRPPDCRN